jgi:hypothetical protein
VIDDLDVDVAILHRLERAGVLHQSARGFRRIGIGSVGGEFHLASSLWVLRSGESCVIDLDKTN